MRSTLNLKDKKKNGETLIYLIAFFKDEDKKFVYSTGETIHPNEWDFKNRQPKSLTGRSQKTDRHRAIKLQLDRYSNFFLKITELYKNTNQEITIENIRAEFDIEFKKVTVGKDIFYEAYDEFMSRKIKNQEWADATIKRYKNIKNILQEFEIVRNYKITFSKINDKFYSEFTDFCMTDKQHINNTYSRNLGLFKTFMLWALNNGYTYNAKFRNFKKKKRVITNQIALKIEDLQKLIAQDFDTARLEGIRDVFVFSCVTGMRFGELKLISKNNIINGSVQLKEEKGAEKEMREVPLNEIALYILRKYDYKLPLKANQKHNDYIKEVFKIAGYTENVEKTTTKGKEVIRETMPFYERVSTHTARRTFITMMKQKGKSDKLISKITGHKDMKTLNQYYQVNDEAKKDAVNDTFDIELPSLKKVN
ncbi:tyrosine-type recombinase/integrase [Kordia sp. YSTF-M3]|uniref:Tyrosine-type recombinase/integrase n=1 Tax=Kordia aestuariivivens TaxID=2759037 RepID=A0ABR7QBM7_9FLAO|nr:tyrosine-type recombinase/integrase [Kordia aestuariivivens]MBC8755971.1 tyrosine-type recombinase/integrase [Kordia aestuariivivens]